MSSDPIRLVEDANAGATLRGDMVHAAKAGLTGLDVSAGAAGLKAVLAAKAGVTGATGAGAGMMVKAALVATGIAALIGVGVALSGPPATIDVEPSPVPVSESAPPPAIAVPPTPVEAEPIPPADTADPGAPTASIQPDTAPAPAPTSAPARMPQQTRRPRNGEARRAEPKLAPKPAPKPAPSSAANADDFTGEAQLLARARRALVTDAATALVLIDQAAAAFPDGMLTQEREALAIRALAGLGRDKEAKRRGLVFLQKHSSGPHAESVQRAIGR